MSHLKPLAGRALALAKQTVHIKMFPTAENFSERREVLRVLEQFGEVTMFRSFKYYPKSPVPNAFLTMFSTEEAASAAINQSPVRYRLISEQQNPDGSPNAEQVSTDTPSAETEPFAAKPVLEKTFELHISNSSYDHQRTISSPAINPLHGPFTPVTPKTSYIAASLNSVLAPSMWTPGLIDWETAGLAWRDDGVADAENKADDDTNNDATEIKSVAWRIQQRHARRKEKETPSAMRGLQDLRREWEENQKKETKMESTAT